jgi:hypothetical protein
VSIPKDGGKLCRLVHEIDKYLHSNTTSIGDHLLGKMPVDATPGSLWQRIQANFDRPPDVITDVIRPAILKDLKP